MSREIDIWNPAPKVFPKVQQKVFRVRAGDDDLARLNAFLEANPAKVVNVQGEYFVVEIVEWPKQ